MSFPGVVEGRYSVRTIQSPGWWLKLPIKKQNAKTTPVYVSFALTHIFNCSTRGGYKCNKNACNTLTVCLSFSNLSIAIFGALALLFLIFSTNCTVSGNDAQNLSQIGITWNYGLSTILISSSLKKKKKNYGRV